MRSDYLFTSECVSEGHPDKVVRPDQRRHRRSVPVEGPRGADRLRNADHHAAGGAGRRNPLQGRLRERRVGRPGAQEEIEATVRRDGQGDRLRTGRLPLGKVRIHQPPARPVRPYRAGRRCRRQQGRRRGRSGHHVRLRHRRNPRSDARDALLQPQDPGAHGGGPPFGRGPVPRARRQEPGDAALRRQPAGRRDRDRRLDPARQGL